jgi:RAB protein geranylgeranyltransferase component A
MHQPRALMRMFAWVQQWVEKQCLLQMLLQMKKMLRDYAKHFQQ